MRFSRLLAIFGILMTVALPAAALAETLCCSCVPPSGAAQCLTIDKTKISATGSCATLPSVVGEQLKGWNCKPDSIANGACIAAPAGACPSGPVDAFSAQSTSTGELAKKTATEEDPQIVPKLNTPIPGLTLVASEDASNPLLAQYIAGAYRYLISVSAVAATIVFTYGAFMYLLGSALPSISSGKRIMQDAVIGMMLVLAATAILRTINPELTKLKSLNVQAITPYSDYESTSIPSNVSIGNYASPRAVCQGSGCAQYCSGCAIKTPLPEAPWIPKPEQLTTISAAPGLSITGVGHPQLRKEAVDALTKAGAAAQAAGGYTLRLGEGYRPLDGQIAASCRFLCGQTQKHFAAPGASMHGTGLAVDVSLWNGNRALVTPQDPLSSQAKNITEANARILQKIMGSSGWVQYCPEIWHWEYGVPEGGEKSKNCPWPPPAPK